MRALLLKRFLPAALTIVCVLVIQSTFFAQSRLFEQLSIQSEYLVSGAVSSGYEAAANVLAVVTEVVGGSTEQDEISAQSTANAQAVSDIAPQTLASGSFIVNMGINAQTKPAGLKPYGLVYDLIKSHSVPVYWVINPNKTKDGVDFSFNGVAYRGGTFVIDKRFITPAVAATISQWTGSTVVNGKGLVVGTYTNSTLTITPSYRLTSVPRWTLDAANGGLATAFFTNAGIPSSAYIAQLPASLGTCDDIYVMPHADPKWATHGNLLNWNLNSKGAIWAACHAVSALENMYNPANISQQTNFLSTKRTTTGTPGDPVAGSTAYAQNALVLWGNHNNGSVPYNTVSGSVPNGTLATPADPVAQFIGAPDAAMLNGSEQIYLPVLGQGWRSSTRIITYDPTQIDVPSKSSGTAVAIAYGRGLGDPNRGLVMYEAGHTIDRGTTGDVPAQRAFFNFSFLTTLDKAPVVNAVTGMPANGIINSTQTQVYAVSATFPLQTAGIRYTWSFTRTDNGATAGSFSPNGTADASTTTFTPPIGITTNVPGIITVKISDGCGRETFESFAVTLTPGPRPPVANPDAASIRTECNTPGQPVTISVLANDTDPDGEPLTVTAVSGSNGSWTTNGTTVTFSPAADFFSGTATGTYTIRDPGGLTASSTISVGLGTPDAQGCFPGSVYGVASTAAATTATATASGVANPGNAVGSSDYEPTDVNTYAVISATNATASPTYTTGSLVLDFGSTSAPANRKLVVTYASASTVTTNNVTMRVESSTDGVNYTVVGTATANNTSAFEANFDLPAAGTRYVRLTRSAGTDNLRIDAVEIETYSCIANSVRASDDVLRANEDIPTTINVLQNDINPGALPLTVTIVQYPTNGRISLNPDNTFTYLGNRDYRGNDQFRYRICNSQGICSDGTVSVIVAADNCSPGNYAPLGMTNPTTIIYQNPTASATDVDDSYLKRDSGGNDNYGGNTTLDVGKIATKERRAIFRFNTISLPAGAVVTNAVFSIYRTGGENIAYTMNAHRLTETWTEASVTWLWRAGSTSPWSNSSGTTGGGGVIDETVVSSTSSTATVGFKDFNVTSLVQAWQAGTPNHGILIRRANPAVDDKVHTYASSENGTAANRPKLVITYVMPQPCVVIPNRAPLANPDYATTNSSTPVSIAVLANDADVDVPVQTLTINSIVSVSGGTAVVDPANNRNIRFTPTATFSGIAQVRYRISDGSLTDEAIAYVTVSRSAPVANRDNVTISSGATATINVVSNDLNVSNSTLAPPVIITNPTKGAASFAGNVLTYTPAPGFYGSDTLVYQLCEAPNLALCNQVVQCDTALVVIRVENRAPVAVADVVTINRCQAVTIPVLANDVDPEGGILTVTILTAPGKGTAVVSGTDIVFTPNGNFNNGSDTFTYRICDDANPALCATASVTVNMNNTPVNGAPVAVNDVFDGIVNNPIYMDVLTNDSDPDNNELRVSLPASGLRARYGTVTVLENNLIHYTPNPGFMGTDTFDYTICDLITTPSGCGTNATSYCATARVTVEVTGLNIVPLPVELVNFKAAAKGAVVELSWKTASELDNDRFEIERSADGRRFEKVGSVQGVGTSSLTNSYSFIDKDPLPGTSYYRLRQVDVDGTFDYSSVRAVNLTGINKEQQMKVYPSPFANYLKVDVIMDIAETATLQILNIQGRVVLSKSLKMDKGFNELTLPVETLSSGVYILRITGSSIDSHTKITKL